MNGCRVRCTRAISTKGTLPEAGALSCRTPQQCFFKTADGLTAGHTGQKQGQEIECAVFDSAYPIGVDDDATQRRREAKIAQAKKDKANALQKLRRQMGKVVAGNKP